MDARKEVEAELAARSEALEQVQSLGGAVCEAVFNSVPPRDMVAARLAEVPDRVVEAVRDGLQLGAHSVLAVVRSHYDSFDLELVGQGLSAFKTDEELDAIRVEVAPSLRGYPTVLILRRSSAGEQSLRISLVFCFFSSYFYILLL